MPKLNSEPPRPVFCLQNLNVFCPLWMHPPDVDLLVLLHPAQSEFVHATTSSDAVWYLYQFATLGYLERYLPSLTSLFQSSVVGAVIRLVASFAAYAMSILSCAKKFARAAIFLYLSPRLHSAHRPCHHRPSCFPAFHSICVRSNLFSSSPLFLFPLPL